MYDRCHQRWTANVSIWVDSGIPVVLVPVLMPATLLRYSAVMAVVWLSACEEYQSAPSFVEVEQDRTGLIAGLASYQTIAEVKSALGPLAEEWEILEDNRKSAD